MNEKKRYKIGISGSYGGLNLGDEAILQCIICQLRRSLPAQVTVFSRVPDVTLLNQDADRSLAIHLLPRDEIALEIKKLDLLIIGGGGILFDGEAREYMQEAKLAREAGVPVMVYAVGAGPLNEYLNQQMVQDVLQGVEVITVRERNAKKVLEETGLEREITVTADPAMLLRPEALPQNIKKLEGLDREKILIGISVREPGPAAPGISAESYHSLLANAADFMVDRFNAEIVFVPMERNVLDLQHSHAVISRMLRPQHARVLRGSYTPGQMLSLIKNFSFVVGMRLHFLIFAALESIPFVALPYAGKVMGFLEDLSIEAPPLQLVNAGRLIAYIDKTWDRKTAMIKQLEEKIPLLRARAQENNRILVELLESIDRKG